MNDRKSKPKKASRSKQTKRQTNRGQRHARQERLWAAVLHEHATD
ncbi:hypothetical protein WJ542_03155 [Paraburkholderia sp. B3]|nr:MULTISPECIES: hypothetical protein [Burkholderia]MDR5643225.1 hypothetical protein [Burkholderia cenocepacia]UUX37153.1 hypothetical protein NTJ56_17710 [Burkholderia contaminans]